MRSDRVSVVVPVYNRAHLIVETIQSVINQTYTPWELIIVDDGSTDETKSCVKEFNDPRIRYFRIDHTGSIGHVRNVGMSHAIGDYIAFLDSDDLWVTTKLEYQISLFKRFPHAFFAFSNGEQFGEGSTPTPVLEKLFAGNTFLPFLLEERFIFYVPGLIFKREILVHLSGINERFKGAGDIHFFLRMAHRFDGVFVNDALVKIRKHGQSHSNDHELLAFEEYLVMLKSLFSEGCLSKNNFAFVAARYHYKLGLFYYKLGNSRRAREEFIHSIKSRPFRWKGWVRFLQSLFNPFKSSR